MLPPSELLALHSFLFSRVAAEGRRRMAEGLRPLGLRLPHYAILSCLDTFGPAPQIDIAERLSVNPADMTRLVDALEDKGYVVRLRDPNDRRRYSLSLTKKGNEIHTSAQSAANKVQSELLFPLETGEKRELHAMLMRLLTYHYPETRDQIPG